MEMSEEVDSKKVNVVVKTDFLQMSSGSTSQGKIQLGLSWIRCADDLR